MKNKFVMIIGLVMIILAIGFRAICYFFLDRALLDRDDVFKNNNEKILFYELYGIIDDVELNLENIKESDLKEICYESSKQDATNKLIKIKAGIDKVSSIYIALNDGHLIATNITNGFSVTETERWYQETLKTRKSVICSRENNEGNPTFMVTVPLYIEGTFRGVIGGEINSETIKKIINNYTDNPYQLLLKDSQNEILYRHTRNTNLTRNIDQRIFYMPQADDAVTFDKHNFKIEVYYNENEALQAVMPVKIVFSILSIIVIISYITTLFNTRANSDFIKCSFILFVLTIFEWFGAAFLITTRYDEDLLKMLESLKAHMAYTEDIFNDVSDEIYGTFTNIFNKDGVVSDEDKIQIGAHVTRLKAKLSNFIGIFLIDKYGNYINIPYVEDDLLSQINFKNNRLIIHDYQKSTLISFDEAENFTVFSKLYKIKNQQGEINGVCGINFKITPIVDFVCLNLHGTSEKRLYDVLDDGSFYSQYYNESYQYDNNKKYKGNLNFAFTDKKKKEISDNDFGIILSEDGVNAERYIYLTDYDGISKSILYITLENKYNVGTVLVYSVLILFTSLIVILTMSLLLGYRRGKRFNDNEIEREYENEIEAKKNVQASSDEDFEEKKVIFVANDENINKINDETLTRKIKNKFKKYIEFINIKKAKRK